MMIRRLAILGSLTAALIALGIAPAAADDLSDYLEAADEAVYSGRRLVGTTWDGIEAMGVIDVQHVGGMTMVGSGSTSTMVGHGKVRAVGSDGVAIEYDRRSHVEITHGYVVTSRGRTFRAGRVVEVREIFEGDRLRMRMVVDVSTAAPVETEVFDTAGNRFRYSAMVEFSPTAPEMVDYQDDGDYYMMLPLDQAQLPGQIWRYQLVDAYSGPGEAEQGFYSDGLFRHSLFTVDGHADLDELAPQGAAWVIDGFEYVRVVGPAQVWVFWHAPDATFALVGDLPPDHLESVLAELPRPDQRNWFSRMWNRLFG